MARLTYTLLRSSSIGEIRQALVHINKPTDSDTLVLGAKELISTPTSGLSWRPNPRLRAYSRTRF
jgi:hypothetical protein